MCSCKAVILASASHSCFCLSQRDCLSLGGAFPEVAREVGAYLYSADGGICTKLSSTLKQKQLDNTLRHVL